MRRHSQCQLQKPRGRFSLTVKSNAPASGNYSYIYWVYTGEQAPLPGSAIAGLTQIATQQRYTPGSSVRFQVPWGQLCSKVVNSGQQGAPIQAVRVYYKGFPALGTDPFPNYNAAEFTGVDPFFDPVPLFTDIGVNTDGSLVTNKINGLTGGLNYYFRVALVDVAGNVGYLTDATDNSIFHTAIVR